MKLIETYAHAKTCAIKVDIYTLRIIHKDVAYRVMPPKLGDGFPMTFSSSYTQLSIETGRWITCKSLIHTNHKV